MYLILFLVCFFACGIGAISGIGGGVIIKPIIDSMGVMSISELNFLSGFTVLTMSVVSLIRALKQKVKINFKIAMFIGIGAIFGGVFGKQIFEIFKLYFANEAKIGFIQSILLFAINLFIYIYIKKQSKMKSFNLKNKFICIILGIFLGIVSSFLGIGGGPLNIALMYLLFSMEPKQTTVCSLVIVFFSQISAFITTLVNGVPDFSYKSLILMCLGGVFGAYVGGNISKKMDNEKVRRFFIKVLSVLFVINIWNITKFYLDL